MKRREFLQCLGTGLGSMMLAPSIDFAGVKAGEINTGMLTQLDFMGKAKRVIFLSMSGGPSQFETFDHKPLLTKMNGKAMPAEITAGQQLAQLQGRKLECFGSQFGFKKWGESGQEISELFPHLGTVADDMTIIKTVHTDQINHDPAMTMLNTGTFLSGRPSMGSWVNYAMGSECKDLPGFVVLDSMKGRNPQPLYSRLWHSGFIPSRYQGVPFNSKGSPVHYLERPNGVKVPQQDALIRTISEMNNLAKDRMEDPEIDTRNMQIEMARRMQQSVPEVMDLSREPQHILDMYGCTPGDGTFASNCLLARKLAERGVRFIQLYHRGWDHHDKIGKYMPMCADAVDQGTAALMQDLKQRGMLDETLIIWTGEFGRTPMSQGTGRDHHMLAFSMFMAGGGLKGGITRGETDEFGYKPVKDPTALRDIHATMLHQLGVDHSRLTYKFQGLDNRLTSVEEAHVLKDILAG